MRTKSDLLILRDNRYALLNVSLTWMPTCLYQVYLTYKDNPFVSLLSLWLSKCSKIVLFLKFCDVPIDSVGIYGHTDPLILQIPFFLLLNRAHSMNSTMLQITLKIPVFTYHIHLFTRALHMDNQSRKTGKLPSSICLLKLNGRYLVATSSTNRRSVLMLWTLENVILASFGVNILKILLELPWKMLRFAVYMGSDQHKKVGFVCVACDFSANATFNHYRSPLKLCHKTSGRHHNKGCASIWACATERMNTVCT